LAPWDFCEFHPCFDVEGISGYHNHFTQEWVEKLPKFDGIESHAIQHIVLFLEYVLNLDVSLEDVLIKLFVFSLEMKEKYVLSHILGLVILRQYLLVLIFLRILLKCWGPNDQDFEDIFKDYVVTMQEYKRYKVINTFEKHDI
jgi:hypothetical protein